MLKTDYFDTIDTAEKAYWLGFICADGHIFKSLKQLSILLSSRDKDHLKKFADLFERPLEVTTYQDKRTQKNYERVRLMLNSKKLCLRLISLGVAQQKSLNLTGSVIEAVPAELAYAFVRGYFDGDGCISKVNASEYRVAICGTKSFLETLKEHLPVTSTLHSRPGVWVLRFCGLERINTFSSWLYAQSGPCLERKKSIFDLMPKQRGSSRYRGVYYIKSRNHWIARIYKDKKMKTLGRFKTEEEAYRCLISKDVVGFDSATPALMSDFAAG